MWRPWGTALSAFSLCQHTLKPVQEKAFWGAGLSPRGTFQSRHGRCKSERRVPGNAGLKAPRGVNPAPHLLKSPLVECTNSRAQAFSLCFVTPRAEHSPDRAG